MARLNAKGRNAKATERQATERQATERQGDGTPGRRNAKCDGTPSIRTLRYTDATVHERYGTRTLRYTDATVHGRYGTRTLQYTCYLYSRIGPHLHYFG